MIKIEEKRVIQVTIYTLWTKYVQIHLELSMSKYQSFEKRMFVICIFSNLTSVNNGTKQLKYSVLECIALPFEQLSIYKILILRLCNLEHTKKLLRHSQGFLQFLIDFWSSSYS